MCSSWNNNGTQWMHAHQYIGVPECHDLASVHERHRWGRSVVVIVTPWHATHHRHHTLCTYSLHPTKQYPSSTLFTWIQHEGIGPNVIRELPKYLTDEWHKSVPVDIEHSTSVVVNQSCVRVLDRIDTGDKTTMWKLNKFPEMCSSEGRAARTLVCRTMTPLCRSASAQRKCSRADSAPSAKMAFFTVRKLMIFFGWPIQYNTTVVSPNYFLCSQRFFWENVLWFWSYFKSNMSIRFLIRLVYTNDYT